MGVNVEVFADAADLSGALAKYVYEKSEAAIGARGRFTVALSGGSLPNILAQGLTKEPFVNSVQWSKWHVFFADERYVALTHADSNYLACKALFNKVPIPENQIYALDYGAGSLQRAAEQYESQIRSAFAEESGTPQLDLVLLGMGPDGHTCSLFPGHPLLQEKSSLITWISDSPKPPPERITFTYPLLDAAHNTAFVVTGEAKADVARNILREKNSGHYPAGLINPSTGLESITWFMDQPAASKL